MWSKTRLAPNINAPRRHCAAVSASSSSAALIASSSTDVGAQERLTSEQAAAWGEAG
jgi:hypothetical protein